MLKFLDWSSSALWICPAVVKCDIQEDGMYADGQILPDLTDGFLPAGTHDKSIFMMSHTGLLKILWQDLQQL
jgi:hypothetical protein